MNNLKRKVFKKRTIQRIFLGLVFLCAYFYISILVQVSSNFETVLIESAGRVKRDTHQHVIVDPRKYVNVVNPPSTSFWDANRAKAEELLQTDGPHKVRRPLTAYLEHKLNDTVSGTERHGDEDTDEFGSPSDFYIPLPVRTNTPEDLVSYLYPQLQTCRDLPARLPIDRGLLQVTDPMTGKKVTRNLLDEPTPPSFFWDEAPFCPVDADPFLPWIHDIIPSIDGFRIEFVAQNKRRCRTGSNHHADVDRLTPLATYECRAHQ